MMLRLAPHIHLASVEDDFVFLDARADRYICIAADDAAELREALTRDTARTPGGLLAELVDEGLLAGGAGGRRWSPPAVVASAGQAAGDDDAALPLRAGIVLCLAAAALRAFWYRRRRLDRWFMARRRRAPRAPRMKLDEALHHFERLRPWVPDTGNCLPNTIMLTEYLWLLGHAVPVIFGVRVHPFEAHCWAQAGEDVLNDSLEHVRWFTPIAAV